MNKTAIQQLYFRLANASEDTVYIDQKQFHTITLLASDKKLLLSIIRESILNNNQLKKGNLL